MASISVDYFNNLAKFLKIPLGKISIKDNVCIRTHDNKTTIGVINIIFSLLKESKLCLKPNNHLDEAQMRQWLEYTIIYLIHNNQNLHSTFKDLNEHLETKTYLVNEQFSIADAFLYYVLVKTMINLSPLDKEKYIHVSRWFDNVQQDSTLRQSNNLINFNTNYLATLVPAKH
ncbi:aaRS-interacting multifunctional protein 3 [Rhynchophorus ferrugineus]|uniref:aaRS-interacting multifunctional protein 3 n=1 Tax=Rhynchophorus ferrugineus TaxID=354439 RepID=UPI003FCC71DC